MISPQRLFKRALAEKLAFVPMGASQAAGPGGAPVEPGAAGAAGGAPMDPAAGGAPMDPAAAGGGAPMDPAMAAMPPMDPAAGGMPPADPAAMGGAPPVDPAAMGALPPMPEPEQPNSAETDVNSDGKPDTMVPLEAMKSFTVGVIEAMKGRQTAPAKQEAAKAEAAAADAGAMPGPVTGMAGFDPSMIQGPMKTASILSRAMRR